VTSFCQTY